MWRELLGFMRDVLLLKEQTAQNTADLRDQRDQIREIEGEIRQLTLKVQELSIEFRHFRERQADDRAKLVMQLDRQLLLFERRLPSGPPTDPGKGE